jgi:hypothetical protein
MTHDRNWRFDLSPKTYSGELAETVLSSLLKMLLISFKNSLAMLANVFLSCVIELVQAFGTGVGFGA